MSESLRSVRILYYYMCSFILHAAIYAHSHTTYKNASKYKVQVSSPSKLTLGGGRAKRRGRGSGGRSVPCVYVAGRAAGVAWCRGLVLLVAE